MNVNRRLLASGVAALAVVLLIPVAVAAKGAGTLYIYTDTWGGTEAPREPTGNKPYLVDIGGTYYIRVCGITEFAVGDEVEVKVAWTDTGGNPQNTLYTNVLIITRDGKRCFEIAWTVPGSAQYCTTGTVHYSDASSPDYIARGVWSNVGHFHVVPEVTLGSIGASVLFLSTLGLFAIHKKRRTN